jgi:hypothetical protein
MDSQYIQTSLKQRTLIIGFAIAEIILEPPDAPITILILKK